MSFWFGESGDAGKAAPLERARIPPHIPCPVHLFHLLVSELYPFLINW